MSPAPTSKPAASIRRRASTPASNQVPFPAATQFAHPIVLISAIACICGPSALIFAASPVRSRVLSAASGGTDT